MSCSSVISPCPDGNALPVPADPAILKAGLAIPFAFALTLFISASLLFCIQPMIAKMILPVLGGSPSVWSTCMVFFQAVLLAGYTYAYAMTAWLRLRRQAALHFGVLLLPVLVLPLAITPGTVQAPSPAANPSVWLLGLLLTSVGLPFFVGASTAPLLQKWFAETGHPAGKDPYFLYGASNLGSLIALLGYPILMEPGLRLAQQSLLWSVGYGVLAVLTFVCAVLVVLAPRDLPRAVDEPIIGAVASHPLVRQRLSWVALAFIPSSLLLGVTTYLSTDVASIPLFWIIPLALYLVTFILAFSRREILPLRLLTRVSRPAILVLVLVTCLYPVQVVFIPLHLLVFFLAASVCHGELARRRPSVRHLTEFYLAISLGGVLGGVFNALIAPVVFDRVVEYPLAMVLACLALPGVAARSGTRHLQARVLDFAFPLALGSAIVGVRLWLTDPATIPTSSDNLTMILAFSLGSLICFTFVERPVRFALGIAALLGSGMLMSQGQVLHRERSFFGSLSVVRLEPGPYHQLIHGTTVHGQQSLDPHRRQEPLTYYYRTGPIGQVFEVFGQRSSRPTVAVVGLGTGSLAAYAQPGERWTFYEIDPSVARIASNPAYFTYLRDCRASAREIVLGDARLRLRDAPGHRYDLIVLDAFSSDSIPVHLLTREAIDLYRSKLAPDGMMAFHISNRHLDLATILGAVARDEDLVCRVRRDTRLNPDEQRLGKSVSTWAILANRENDLGSLATDPAWVLPRVRRNEAAWTDDFSNIFEHFVIF
jgi:hypothetical protein